MSQVRAVAGMERLPWLADEPTPQVQPTPSRQQARGPRELAGWAVAAVLVVAGASYWIGAHSGGGPAEVSQPQHSATTVPLPQPRASEPAEPQVVLEPAPEVRPVSEREVSIARPPMERRSSERRPATPARREARVEQNQAAAVEHPAPAPARPVGNPDAKPLTVWPAWESQGAHGRIVRIGAFGTRDQAKLGWRYMVRAYPAVARLKATVVTDRNSRGRYFYRFQIGTTSQAHSEVLCQRMERIRLSCAVVGLPWKPRGVER
jgi:hypothetical protein